MEDRTGIKRFFGLIAAVLGAFLSTACEIVTEITDTGLKPDVLLESSQTAVTGAGPLGCPALAAPSLELSGNSIHARYSQSSCAKLQICLDSSVWNSLTPKTFTPGIDLVILFDTTGSMSPYIQAMIKNMQQLIINLNTLTPNLRLGLASFRDFADRSSGSAKIPTATKSPIPATTTDYPFLLHAPLTTDTQEIVHALGTLKARGGGDLKESLATAIKAAVDGKALAPYFGASDMNWGDDASRVKIVLGITDAANRDTNLPDGAPTLERAAALMKEKGILFLGIGRKGRYDPSFDDLSKLAELTGAIVRAPGVDLNGDGRTDADGELAAGSPAVLQMDGAGNLLGTAKGSSPSRTLADAIAALVEQTLPFQFNLDIDGNSHSFSPATNTLAVSSQIEGQRCFTPVIIQPKISEGCPDLTVIKASVSENSVLNSNIDPSLLKAVLEVNLSCDGRDLSEHETVTPGDPTEDEDEDDVPPPICVGPGCGGGWLGV